MIVLVVELSMFFVPKIQNEKMYGIVFFTVMILSLIPLYFSNKTPK